MEHVAFVPKRDILFDEGSLESHHSESGRLFNREGHEGVGDTQIIEDVWSFRRLTPRSNPQHAP